MKSDSHRYRSRNISEYISDLLTYKDDEAYVLFCQLDILTKKDQEFIWRESARCVKYEENVEENGQRWSKPHVASITLHNLFELRSQMSSGTVMLDVNVKSVPQVADLLLEELSKQNTLDANTRNLIWSILVTPHVHPHLKKSRSGKSGGKLSVINQCRITKTNSSTDASNFQRHGQKLENGRSIYHGNVQEPLMKANTNKKFMKKISSVAEVANVWVGEVEGLNQMITGFIRLRHSAIIGDITEVPLPTRFLFVHFAPPGIPGHVFEIGRAMANMMVDEIFSEVAYKARTREDIVHAMDEFLDQVTVLPPGQWNPEIRIDPPIGVPSQDKRKVSPIADTMEDTDGIAHGDPTLKRTGRIFGGLIADIKRKAPFYLSDFKDGFHIQCVAAVFYLYLATLTPNITFGALLGQSTDHYMGPMECIVTVAFVNIMWALFSGQPLIIMGSTGPVLVLESIIFTMCRDNHWDFLSFRLWIGLWCALYLMVMVAFDLSALVRYITRFTEESFACLISLIFIVEFFKNMIEVANDYPYNTNPEIPLDYACSCYPSNDTDMLNTTSILGTTISVLSSTSKISIMADVNWTYVKKEECGKLGGVLLGSGCGTIVYHDNIFFLSFILAIGTFAIAWILTKMKNSTFFPTIVRQRLADFAVFISICIMVSIDFNIGINTPKLVVPSQIQPSRSDRGWFISPFSEIIPWWRVLIASLPALVALILFFMDHQITAVIINRKENKLKKGSGYHLDLTVLTICIVVCSLFGLPWYVSATVRSMAHLNSLKRESECTAPGEKSIFLGCREQRVTSLVVAILNGCSVFMTDILKIIPMPVLYGVFLYMGVSSLKGQQFIDRLLILFMPAKYQPDHIYLRHVRTKRVHIFTIIQILCLAVLWVIKAIKSVSIAFPLMLLGTCFVRKGMEKFFTKKELKWLDDLMPEAHLMKQEDDGELVEEDDFKDESDKPIEFLSVNIPGIRKTDGAKKRLKIVKNGKQKYRGILQKSNSDERPIV